MTTNFALVVLGRSPALDPCVGERRRLPLSSIQRGQTVGKFRATVSTVELFATGVSFQPYRNARGLECWYLLDGRQPIDRRDRDARACRRDHHGEFL